MDVRPRQNGTQVVDLLKNKKGTIHYQVRGFWTPFRITSIEFYSLRRSTRYPGKFERDYRLRENDLVHFEGAVKIVRKWIKGLDEITARNWRGER